MPRSDGPSDSEMMRNLHVEVPDSFHKRVKILAIQRGMKLNAWVIEGLKEKLERDEAELQKKTRRGNT